MPLNIHKNQHYSVTFTDLGKRGEGVGHIDGFVVYVPGALPGDIATIKLIKQKKRYGFGRLISIDTPSPHRVNPRCAVHHQCGGCQIQHMAYEAQLGFKKRHIADVFKRIGKIDSPQIRDVRGMSAPYHFRNKAQFAISNNDDSVHMGFYAINSHRVVDTEHCPVQDPIVEQILGDVRSFLNRYDISIYDEDTHSGLVRHLVTRVSFHTGKVVVGIVINGTDLPHANDLSNSLLKLSQVQGVFLNHNVQKGDTVLGSTNTIVSGNCLLEERINDVTYNISPLSFFQVNPIQTQVLFDTIIELASFSPDDICWDLYSGTGSISLQIAPLVSHVLGIEFHPDAVEDAKKNALLNAIKNVDFIEGSTETILGSTHIDRWKNPSIVVLDPPRKGCEESVLRCIATKTPSRIVYVSCDPATLARDVAKLCEFGYTLECVQPVDMFPHTVHIESVSLLKRR